MALQLPIGVSDFRKLRERNAVYIKTHRIIVILDQATGIFVMPRPQRFGKTLNPLSTIHYPLIFNI